MFAQGQVAFYDDAVVAKGQAVNNGVAPEDVVKVCSAMSRPVLNAGDQPQSTMWDHMLVTFQNSEYQQEAAELAKTLVSDEVAMDYFENNGMPPVTKSMAAKDEVKNDAYLNGFLSATATAVSRRPPAWPTPARSRPSSPKNCSTRCSVRRPQSRLSPIWLPA